MATIMNPNQIDRARKFVQADIARGIRRNPNTVLAAVHGRPVSHTVIREIMDFVAKNEKVPSNNYFRPQEPRVNTTTKYTPKSSSKPTKIVDIIRELKATSNRWNELLSVLEDRF